MDVKKGGISNVSRDEHFSKAFQEIRKILKANKEL
jgi:hypothetical protein